MLHSNAGLAAADRVSDWFLQRQATAPTPTTGVSRMNLSKLAARVGAAFETVPQLTSVVHGAAVGVLLASASLAQAAPTASGATNVNVPSTTAGVYINVVTGAFGTAAATTGWDVNPWGSTTMAFFNASAPTGGTYVLTGAGGTPASLAVGSTVGSTSVFGSGTASFAGTWSLNAINYFGFRFLNEGNGLVHYGYGAVQIGASAAAQPRTVLGLWFESEPGVAITVSAVPEPTSWAMMLAGGLAIAGAAVRRRRQNRA